MFKMRVIASLFSVLLVSVFTLENIPAQVRAAPSKNANDSVQLDIADWKQIRAFLPLSVVESQAYFKPSKNGMAYHFGSSVAISGDTVVIGSPIDASNATGVNGDQSNDLATGSGAAYVFVRIDGVWSQQAYLKASNTRSGGAFGYSVAISGDTVVVGAIGEGSSATGVNGNQADNSAYFSGAAYVFTRSGNTWTQEAYLKASNTGRNDFFGQAVAIDGDTIVVGADSEDSNATGVNGDESNNGNGSSDSGAAYIFTRSGGVWSQQAYLKESISLANDAFGHSVAIFGDTVVVGAPYAFGESDTEPNISMAGAVYVFVRSGSVWSHQARLNASNPGFLDRFARSVAISGDTLVVGACQEDSGGAVYVFTRNGTAWSQQAYLKSSNGEVGDAFGWVVAIAGDILISSSILEDSNAVDTNGNQSDNSATDSGAVYIFERSGGVWNQQTYLKASNSEADDQFGYSAAISGNTILIGSALEDSNATGLNGNQGDNSLTNSGAAYAFILDPNGTPMPPTATNTATMTVSLTPTVTETATPTLTETSTSTATVSVTATMTASPSPTPSLTSTITKTATPTPTVTKTNTPSTFELVANSLAAHDGWVLESSRTSSQGGTLNSTAETFYLGDNAAKKQYRSILSFSTARLPDNATIKRVLLTIRKQSIVGAGDPMSIFKGFMLDVRSGFFGSAATLELADFGSPASATYAAVPDLLGDFYIFDLSAAKAKINKLKSQGGLTQIRLRFRLADDSNTVANYLSGYSSDARPDSRPRLAVLYSVP